MEINVENLEIRLNTKAQRFYFTEEKFKDAQLQYKLHTDTDPNTVEFTHTFVPEPLRDTGLGTEIVDYGIRWAVMHGYQIKPTCPFVKDYMESRDDYKKLI